ncbi:hypothetical protein BKA70DRAFT_1459970 [Coprinopsis sp. MPI-PUGE-AT-0042]|nr:hypothetical protein BKA70DRAFT_1459970 [Coprinopsis sp. MPI-PUGE-AT-0042]
MYASCLCLDPHWFDNIALTFQWGFTKLDDDDHWLIFNDDGFLSVDGGVVRDNVYALQKNDAFTWKVIKDWRDRDVWRIVADNSPFHLELVNGGDSTSGTAIRARAVYEGRNQCWRIEAGTRVSSYFFPPL